MPSLHKEQLLVVLLESTFHLIHCFPKGLTIFIIRKLETFEKILPKFIWNMRISNKSERDIRLKNI